MKTREFTISTKELDYNYNLNVRLVEDYIFEDLEVPQDYVESLKICDNRVNIKLSPNKKYFNDD